MNDIEKTCKRASQQLAQHGILSEIEKERARQDSKWGGASHDDQHSTADFCRWIKNYAGWADQMADAHSFEKARNRLIQVAALAVAAVESIERRTMMRDVYVIKHIPTGLYVGFDEDFTKIDEAPFHETEASALERIPDLVNPEHEFTVVSRKTNQAPQETE